jgi:hypothetical protein
MSPPENTDDEPRIPVLTKPMSVLATGLNANHLASAAASKHPVQGLQQRDLNPYRDLAHIRHVYGSALAMTLATERTVAARQHEQLRAYRGGGGAAGASLYGEIVTGTDVDLQFEDYLGAPQDRPDYLGAGGGTAAAASGSMMTTMALPHAVLEHQLRMG